jgi:hypothetical protein
LEHYRKDNPNGITAPNPDGNRNIVEHITKHRGMKTPYTSVSEDPNAIRHFSGELYKTDPDNVIADGHNFKSHSDVTDELRSIIQTSARSERILANRAFQYAKRAKEALIDWQFSLDNIRKKHRISWCYNQIQKYFQRV